MGTTIPSSEDTRDRLDAYRRPGHDSWDDLLRSLLTILPDPSVLYEEGCGNCGRTSSPKEPLERTGGVIHFWEQDIPGGGRIANSEYFCTADCFQEFRAEVDRQVPREPDKVVVGGDEMIRAEIENATYHLDGMAQQIGLDVPGAFSGSDSGGVEYDYIGEPVYIYNAGQWVGNGVIEDIFHEDAHTTLDLGSDYDTVYANHPDESERESYFEERDEYGDQDETAAEES